MVEKSHSSQCKVTVGFHKYGEFMQCVAQTKDYESAQEIISKWVNTKADRKNVSYALSQLEVEFFLNNESIGKPFKYLVDSGKCKFIEKP